MVGKSGGEILCWSRISFSKIEKYFPWLTWLTCFLLTGIFFVREIFCRSRIFHLPRIFIDREFLHSSSIENALFIGVSTGQQPFSIVRGFVRAQSEDF